MTSDMPNSLETWVMGLDQTKSYNSWRDSEIAIHTSS
jgi:hypothetical protein